MSYAEVEQGLPPVEVFSPPFQRGQRPQQQSQRRGGGGNTYSDIETDTPHSSLERVTSAAAAAATSIDKRQGLSPAVFQVQQSTPSQPHPQHDWNELQKLRRPQTPMHRPSKIEGVYSLEELSDDEDDLGTSQPFIDRARKFGGFVLILLPGIFGALIVQFIKYLLNRHALHVIELCIFQGVFWPSAFFCVYGIYWMKRPVFKTISCKDTAGWRNLGCLIVLGVLASIAVILQIVSLFHIDITVSLAIAFSPFVFAALIEHIALQQRFSLELIFTTLVAYAGIVLLCVAPLTISDWKLQRRILIGVSTAVGSMTFAVPATLLLHRLRRNKVEDSLSATTFSIIGTIVTLLLFIGSTMFMSSGRNNYSYEADPGLLATLIVFTLCGTFFQYLDALYRSPGDGPSSSPSSISNNPIILMLSATRMEIFILSGIWEILKRGIFPEEFDFPSVFSIFGVLLIVLSYALTIAFQTWNKEVILHGNDQPQLEESNGNEQSPTAEGRVEHQDKRGPPNKMGLEEPMNRRPFEFVPWLFSRSFV